MNSSPPSQSRQEAFRSVISDFLLERLNAKLEKLPPDDPKRDALKLQFDWDAWMEDAARRVSQIQAVTHSLKATHPDARGTNLYCRPEELPRHKEVGTHTLGLDLAGDVVGNAAALDVYKFLRLNANNTTLLEAILANDIDLKSTLNTEGARAQAWMDAFATLVQPRGDIASHTRAKQVFWLVGDDPCNNNHYHLLSPLYPSSLAHAVYGRIQEDRFSEATKAARQARRNQQHHPQGYVDYPNLAVQKLGGTKPQNISQLNSERGGNNYLLASLSPRWKSREIRAPWHRESTLKQFGARPFAKLSTQKLLALLKNDPAPTMMTRNQRDALVDGIIDEFILFGREMQQGLASGWSAQPQCLLSNEERLWLDPYRAIDDERFRKDWLLLHWPNEIGKRFGNWLNNELDGLLPMSEVEHKHWVQELLGDQEWATGLDVLREQIPPLESSFAGEPT